MKKTDILIVGGGPAGLCAAINAAASGANVTLIDRNDDLGGQLTKQTHMFFGSQKQHASKRGIDIVTILLDELKQFEDKIEIITDATVMGIYEDGIVTVEKNNQYFKFKPTVIIAACGASEKFLAFQNNDLPGIYGAGAVQTLMNVYGVAPGKNVVMVGAGNIGLIVSYQLLQAGVNIKAIIDASPKIGGYLVHASKIRRMGIPIYTSHSIKMAHGKDSLEKVTIHELDENWQPKEGTEKTIDADVLCISVGLSPLTELLWQAGCEMLYVPELGGHVPVRDENHKTSIPNLYVAGDVSGVEEASSAMVSGRLAGICAAKSIGFEHENYASLKEELLSQLLDLRSGPAGEKIRYGLEQVECRRF